jgi:hypothetical protein
VRITTRFIGLILALSAIACQGDVFLADEEPPVVEEVIEPNIPTSMDDCDGEIFAGQAPMRLLTRYEYDYTVRDLLGIQTTIARDEFPPENSVAGFENNSDSHRVSPLMVRKLMEAAEVLAADALANNRDRLVSCDLSTDECLQTFLTDFLLHAFRRPAAAGEIALYTSFYKGILELDGAEQALLSTIELTLQSPQFLYRIELKDEFTAGQLVPLNAYETASRLSYFLWGSMPDEELLEAASKDELATADQVKTQARRMLEKPAARALINDFYRQWLGLDALDSMVKDNTAYPEWTPEMTQEWRDSLYAFIDHVHFDQKGDLSDLMTSPEVFLSEGLAPVYGFEATKTGMNAFVAPSSERAGLLTQPAVMALLAYPTQGSPIHRGIFVRERLLCQKLPPPPNNLLIKPPDPDPNATTRQVFEEHTNDPACAGCHMLIDPIGLGFENYDGIGRYRVIENGQAVDATGALGHTADPSIEGDFDGAVSLSGMLAEARQVEDCVADHWYTFAMGHPETPSDMCAADQIRTTFATTEGSFEDLLIAIATSDAFRYRTVQVPVQGDP